MYLNCKTYFSFCYGTYSTKELVEAAIEQGITTLALTNINTTCDTWDFVKYCREAGIRPIPGVEIRNGDTLLYILLAASDKGLAWIHAFLSFHLTENKKFPEPGSSQVFFTDQSVGFVIYPLGAKPCDQLLANERIGVLPIEVTKLYGLDIRKHADKFIIRQPVTVQNKTYHALHRLLRSIDKNILLSKLPPQAQCSRDETFQDLSELFEAFKAYPFIITNTYLLMDRCEINMDFQTDKNKRTYGGVEEDDRILLEKIANDGLIARYGNGNSVVRERLKKELKTINDPGFNAYFLINYDYSP